MLTAETAFRRRADGDHTLWSGPSVWEDPVFRGVTALAVASLLVPVLVMGIATFMILDQLKIAEDIVRITYMALMFSLALGLALAFGLGGRDLAAQALQSATDKGKEQKDQVKQDFQLGKERGQEQAQQAKDKAQEKVDSGGSESSTRVQSSNPPRPQY